MPIVKARQLNNENTSSVLLAFIKSGKRNVPQFQCRPTEEKYFEALFRSLKVTNITGYKKVPSIKLIDVKVHT